MKMNGGLLAGTALALTSVCYAGRANAAPCAGTFAFTGATQSCTTEQAGYYRITAVGAEGGDSEYRAFGRDGSSASARFFLGSGTQLGILVGGAGGDAFISGGGGGGSFVALLGGLEPEALVVGGGGGGTGSAYFGSSPRPDGPGAGGGGAAGSGFGGGGGGGFYGNGGGVVAGAAGGRSYLSGGGGGGGFSGYGGSGGFGGGGGGDGGGGGGGGFTGGAGGSAYGENETVRRDGSSFVAASGLDTEYFASVRSGNGSVTIAFVPSAVVPLPGAGGMLAAGLIALGGAGALRRRKGRADD